MTDNAPSRKDWKDLYQKAVEFKKLKPWEWMWDRDVFAVGNPETGEVAYCAVMGRMGSFYGMAVYLGNEGLENYFDIQFDEISTDDPDSLYQQRLLMVSFEDREKIEDTDYNIIRKLGLRFRGKNGWPLFRSFRPHYMPWYLEKDEAKFLAQVMEQAIGVCKRLKQDSELLSPPDLGQIFIRIPEKTDIGLKWKDGWMDPWDDEEHLFESEVGGSTPQEGDGVSGSIPEEVNLRPGEVILSDSHYLNIIKQLMKVKPGKEGIWEVDYYFYPEAVQEKLDERPNFPAVITWADHETGEMIEVGLGEPRLWKSFFLETFHNAVIKTQHLPRIIQYENEELIPLLKFTPEIGVELDEVYELEVLGPAKGEILSSDDNPVMEVMNSILDDESIQKLLEMVTEDENLAELIRNGNVEEVLKNEKVLALIKEGNLIKNILENSPPTNFRDKRAEKKNKQREKTDNSQQTFFQTDSDSEKAEKSIYQFRIDLDDIRPPIWRRILIPGTYTMRDLHQAIQDVMGWEDYHLHQFMVADPFTGQPITMENHDEETEIIEDWFTMETPRGSYTYDFGDNWEHIIKLEGIISQDKGATYPQCIKGKRACPPEDCGGVWGYQEILDILTDPKHEEYEETVEWMGEDFDPERFNPEDVVFRAPDNTKDDI